MSRLSPPTPASYKKPVLLVPTLHHLVLITTSAHPHNHITWYRILHAPVFDTIPSGLCYQLAPYRMPSSSKLPHLALATISSGADNYIRRARIPDCTASDTMCRSPHDQHAWNCMLCRTEHMRPCYTFNDISAYLNICICPNSRPEGAGCYVGGLPNCFT